MPKVLETDDDRASKPRPPSLAERDGQVEREIGEHDSDGVPAHAGEEDTSPIELLCEAIVEDDETREIAERLGIGHDLESPATVRQLLAAIRRQSKVRAAARRIGDSAARIADAKTAPIDRLEAVEKQLKIARWVIGVAITAAIGSLGAVANGLRSSGFEEGTLRHQIQTIERDVERNRDEVRDLARRFDRRSARDRNAGSDAAHAATKGTSP